MDKNRFTSFDALLACTLFHDSFRMVRQTLRFSADWHILRLTLVYNVIAIQIYVYFKCTAGHGAACKFIILLISNVRLLHLFFRKSMTLLAQFDRLISVE